MAEDNLTKVLAELVAYNAATARRQQAPNPNAAQFLLSQAPVQKAWNSGAKSAEDPRGPSVVNRILDIMSRPLYSVLNPVKHQLDEHVNSIQEKTAEGDFSGAIKEGVLSSLSLGAPILHADDMWKGLSGKEKTTGRDLLKSSELDQHFPKPLNAAIAFGIDMAADPLNMVGAGGIGKLGKSAIKSTEALNAVEKSTGETARSLTDEIARNASKHAEDLDEVVPTPEMPAPKLNDPPRTFAAGPGPGDPVAEKILGPQKALDEAGEQLALGGPSTARSTAVDDILRLSKDAEEAASPVAKNRIQKELRGVAEQVKPEELMKQAGFPTTFPELTISTRWREAASNVAERFMKNNRLKDINHIGQAKLYDSIVHAASKVRKDRRAFTVLQMLRQAEDVLEAGGRHLTDADGATMRLSDLANMMGGSKALNSKLVDEFRKISPSFYKENLKTFNTSVTSKILEPVVKTGEDIAAATEALPPSRTVMVGSEISKELRKISEAAGASAKEAGTAKKFIDELFNVSNDQVYSAVHQQARNLLRQTTTGVVDSKALSAVTDAAYKSLGESPKILGRQLHQGKVTEGIMTKFATWWGAKDLKPFSREYIDTAKNVAAAFSETIKPLVARTTASQRRTAWAVAQGRQMASGPAEKALADQLRYITERLLGAHGIQNEQSVLARSATVLKEINEELPKALQLVDKKGTDKLGRAFDYSNGNWMHSWKEWESGEPAEQLYQLTRSLQNVTRKNAMWDDAAARWGMPVKGAEYQHQVKNIPRLHGTYFPEAIANQLDSLKNQLDRDVFKTPHKAIELFDKVQRMWKTGVTIYSPSHHIRNLNGDIYLAALDGVTSVRPYTIATKVLHAFPTRYKDMESVFNIMDPALRERALRARPGNHVLTTKYGDKLTSEQIYQAAESQGLFIRAAHIEDLVGDGSAAGTFGSKFQPLGGKVHDAATRASELRDHWVRLAHFVDVLGKSKAPLSVAIEQAGRRVRKFHPDGMDMTGFEQNVLRRVIPFYSWMRKATPLVIEGAIMRPHITMAFPKAMADMQLMTGIESEGPGNPFPEDQMFPDWLKEKGVGPILQPGSGLGRDETWRGKAEGYTIINPTNPFTDQIAQLGSPEKTLFSSLSPAARIPIELLTGQTSLGIPLENAEGGVPGYIAQQVPAIGTAARLTGLTRDNEPFNPEQLINWSTGAGVTGTGPYQQQARTEIQELLANLAKKNRGDYR